MKDRRGRAPGKKQDSSVDSLLRSVYDSLALKVLAEAAGDSPETSAIVDEALDALESSLETALPEAATALETKRARS